MQGVILGNFVQGLEVENRSFSGGPLDWANGFSIITGLSMIFGYALLGATWLIMKTDGITQVWARSVASYVLGYVLLSMMIISISMPFIDQRVTDLWFSFPTFFYLLPIPITTAVAFLLLWKDLHSSHESRPFFISITLFLLGYLGLGISLYPWIVPFQFTIWEAAAAPTSQSLLLIGIIIFLPIILAYTVYNYYVFRGKSSHESMY